MAVSFQNEGDFKHLKPKSQKNIPWLFIMERIFYIQTTPEFAFKKR